MIIYMLLCLVAFNHSEYFFKVTSFLRSFLSLQFEGVSFHFGFTVRLSK